jgi:putative hydrolase of the HAD superfamily
VERGELSQPAFEQKIAQLLGVQPTDLIQGLLADLRPEPLIVEAVARTRTAGIRVGVITNSWGTAPYDPYAAYQLDQQFDAVVISSQWDCASQSRPSTVEPPTSWPFLWGGRVRG